MQDTLLRFLSIVWDKLCEFGAGLIQMGSNWLHSVPYAFSWIMNNTLSIGTWYCLIVRWIMPILALMILTSVIINLIKVKNPEETWAFLKSDRLGNFGVTHWESLIGRGRNCDISLVDSRMSKVHCALIFNGKHEWRIHDLAGKEDILVNGVAVKDSEQISAGDRVNIAGHSFEFDTITQEEMDRQNYMRYWQSKSTVSPVVATVLLTVFQLFTVSSLIINRPDSIGPIILSFMVLAAVMWGYILFNHLGGKTGLEIEILAFFLCSLCLSVTASSNPDGIIKQLVAMIMGIVIFLVLSWYLRDLGRVVKVRHIVGGITCVLLAASIVFGSIHHGAQNWIYIGGISLQPSELAKVCFVFAGAASLERLFNKKNIWGFMGMSFFCFGALALMSDFGTAAIFFITFLVIAFLRSGDYATLSIICATAAACLALMLKIKPYIAARFAVWGHAWENASTTGYQQARTMSAAASGGLIGVGSGEGWLHNVAAANTDLVFGMICEEWGLIIALLAVLGIASISFFAVRVVRSGRSSYYAIAACAAASMLVFQTMLNVFGSVDLFPLTGVTFPFVSCGGSSMLASWGLLAFLKAADTREGASFAVKKMKAEEKIDMYGNMVNTPNYDSGDMTDNPYAERPRAARRRPVYGNDISEDINESISTGGNGQGYTPGRTSAGDKKQEKRRPDDKDRKNGKGGPGSGGSGGTGLGDGDADIVTGVFNRG